MGNNGELIDFEQEYLKIIAFNTVEHDLIEDVLEPIAADDGYLIMGRNALKNGGTALATESSRQAYIAGLQKHLLAKYALPPKYSAHLFDVGAEDSVHGTVAVEDING